MRILLLFLLLATVSISQAQKSQTEIGLNVTNTLAGFFNAGTDVPTDPYLLSLRRVRGKKVLRMGLNFKVSTATDPDFFIDRIVRTQEWNLRMGREFRKRVSEKFMFYWGINAILGFNSERVEASFGFNNSTDLQTWEVELGAGPVAGLRFDINSKMYLSTEAFAYAIYSIGRRTLDGTDPNTGRIEEVKKNVERFTILPAVPNSLYFNFIF